MESVRNGVKDFVAVGGAYSIDRVLSYVQVAHRYLNKYPKISEWYEVFRMYVKIDFIYRGEGD